MNISAVNMAQCPDLTTKQKVTAGVASAAAVTGGILYAAKKGKLDANEGGNLIKEGAKTVLRTYANTLNKAGSFVSDKASAFLAKHEKINGAINYVTDKAVAAKDFTGKKVNSARNFVGEKIENLASKVKSAPEGEVEYYI